MLLVFTWHIDADADIERALMYDKSEEAARIAQGVEAGNRILESWVLRSHGRMLGEAAGVSGTAQLSAEYLEELPDIVRQVEDATKARMHVGVGAEPSEAVIARRIAEERGGDPAIVLYTPDLSEEARKLDEMSDDEASALDGDAPDDDGITGGDAAGAGAPAAASGMAKAENQREGGEATQVAQGQLSPSAAQPSPPPSPSISASAPSPGGQPAPQGQPPQGSQEPSEEEVLSAVGQVLTQFKAQLPFFEQQVKQANPQAYQAVMGMVQGMVAMAQRMAGGNAEATPPAGASGGGEMQKAEGCLCKGDLDACIYCKGQHPKNREQAKRLKDTRQNRTRENALYHELAPKTPEKVQKAEQTKVEMEPDEGSQNDGGVCPKCGSQEATPPAGAGGGQPVKKSEMGPGTPNNPAREGSQVNVETSAFKKPTWKPMGTAMKSEPGEATKVEVEPHKALPPMEHLRKLYDTVSGAPMSMSEPQPNDRAFQEFVAGFKHEKAEHPHLDAYQTALTTKQHLAEDPQYYSKLGVLEESGVLGKEEFATHHPVVLPPGSHGVGAKARSVKVVEPVTGKASWHQVSVGQKLSGDNHPLSPRVGECPSADTPESRAQKAGLAGVPTTAKPGQSATE